MSVLGPPPLARNNPTPETPCPSCGFSNLVGSMNCESCGASLLPNIPPPAQPSAAPGSSAQVVPPGPDDFYVAVWGPESAGKTMYLSCLRDAISSYRYHYDWEMGVANTNFVDFLGETEDRRFRHLFPQPTLTRAPDEVWIEFRNRVPKGPDITYLMKVLDVSGEWYRKNEGKDANGKEVLQPYLENSKGILCLIDPDRPGDNPMMAYLSKLLDNMYLPSRQPISKRLAFCLTKMDQIKHRKYLTSPRDYITQILGTKMMERIKNLIATGNLEFFSCSAIGFYPEQIHQRSNGGINWRGENIIYDAKNYKPFGLFEPIVWLFTGRR